MSLPVETEIVFDKLAPVDATSIKRTEGGLIDGP
jgi:hypothetical protein